MYTYIHVCRDGIHRHIEANFFCLKKHLPESERKQTLRNKCIVQNQKKYIGYQEYACSILEQVFSQVLDRGMDCRCL